LRDIWDIYASDAMQTNINSLLKTGFNEGALKNMNFSSANVICPSTGIPSDLLLVFGNSKNHANVQTPAA